VSEKGKTTILVIDDDEGLLNLVRTALNARNFRIETANSGEKGLELFYKNTVDLVILDVMMPGMNGFEVCQRLRKHSKVPILFLTARAEVQDRVEGLMMGGDDYVVKPFSHQELLARVEALLRRAQISAKSAPKTYRFGGGSLVINSETLQVFVDGEQIHLTPTETQLLIFLAKHSGQVLSLETIYNGVWPYDSEADPKTVRWYIWRLRQNIEPDPSSPQFILTETGIGYRFTVI
jgi:DNA-binding response OmpR family regulator